jgi:hypothetical protein
MVNMSSLWVLRFTGPNWKHFFGPFHSSAGEAFEPDLVWR